MLYNKAIGATASAQKIYIEDAFSTYLYTGNGSTQTITNGIDLSGKGGLVWIKKRNDTNPHRLQDTERGANKRLATNTTGGEITDETDAVTAFGPSGFTLGADTTSNNVNQSTQAYTSWTFRKAAKFFDVVTWVGNGVNNRQISHSLGSEPGFIIVKTTSSTGNWICYHRSLGTGNYLVLSSTQASNNVAQCYPTVTSSYFIPTSDTNAFSGNDNGVSYVAYLFAHDAGGFGDSGNDNVISCGSYTGNGSTIGPTVTLGWEPQWLLVKRSDSTGDWNLIDNLRGFVVGGGDAELNPNLSDAESSGTFISPLATGFQLNTTDAGYNASGGTYIYIAIRRGPMKTPTDATKVFGLSARTGTGASTTVSGGQFNDAVLIKNRGSAVADLLAARLTGTGYLDTSSTQTEFAASTLILQSNPWDVMDGVKVGTTSTTTNASGNSYINYLFRRAPGFFDVVAYTGTGASRTVTHNLGVAPELMVVKRRANVSADWQVYAGAAGEYLVLNSTVSKVSSNTDRWNNATPTSSVFSLGANAVVNAAGGTYIAYLFATCSGISKVGSYNGTGTTQQVNCGFTNGARFVLIKRTDSTGDWYVWDTARGIVSGNDRYVLLNSTAAEVFNTDYIDPLSSGFEISSSAPAAINANGGSFIYLAIA